MPIPIGALIAGGTAIYSALSAKKGQEEANRSQMDFNAQEAQKQRDFEERMFSTRYQVTRKDLEAAGYNPILALGGQPPVPSGAAAHAEPKSTRAEMAAIMSQTAKNVSEVDLLRTTKAKVQAETASAVAQARLDKQMADISTSKAGQVLAWLRLALNSGGREALQAGGLMAGAGRAAKIFNASRAFRRG